MAIIWVHAIAAISAVALLVFSRLGRSHGPSVPEFLFDVANVPLFRSLVSVALLFLIVGALARRKRIALYLVGIEQVLGGAVSLLEARAQITDPSSRLHLHGQSWRAWLDLVGDCVSPIVAVLVLVLLVEVRHLFPGRLARGAVAAAAGILVGGTAVTIAVTHLLLVAATGSGLADARILRYSTARTFGLIAEHDFPDVPEWVLWLTALLMALTVLATAVVLLRSTRGDRTWSGSREVRLRALLAEYGDQDSLGYFATRRDKDLIFSADGAAAVAFAMRGAVCMASGDPIGPYAAWPAAIDAFLEQCRSRGWVPAVVSSGERAAREWARAGMLAVTMGDEAVLHADRFDLATTSMTAVRRAVAHARRAGLSASVRRHASLTDAEREQLMRLAEQWRQGGDERGFSMALGRLGDPADGSCVLVVAEDAAGQWQGLLSFVPWGRHGASLDVMRRSPEAPGGVTELMVSTLLDQGGDIGIREVSLNFAMFRQVFVEADEVGAGPLALVSGRMLSKLDRYFQLERLYRSNQKYHPDWVRRYLLVDTALSLPSAALAAGALEGFLPVPAARRRAPAHLLDEEQLAQVAELDARRIDVAELAPRRSDQSAHRVRHLHELRDAGMEPYPVGLTPPQPFAQVAAVILETCRNRQPAPPDASAATAAAVLRVAGRVRRLRDFGGVCFADIVEGGQQIQALLSRATMPRAQLALWRRAVDTGDIVLLEGHAGSSATGAPSLIVSAWQMASKALQPIPFDAFEDPEARLRSRSTDLIVHPRSAGLLHARSAVIRAVRDHFQAAGFTEVETPILVTVHGGANARPFRTHINAYSSDLTLRIAPELALKRLLVGGMGPIFEIGKNFRNEGADATHNPEFTVIEAYQPFSDYHGMRRLAEGMIKAAARSLFGAAVLPLRDVRDAAGDPPGPDRDERAARLRTLLRDVSAPWPVVTVCEALSERVGRPITLDTDIDELLALAREHEVHVHDGMGPGALIEELYGELVEPETILPTFYVDFPRETSPLTAPHRRAAGLVERWDLVIGGMEIGTAYSELADPLEQRRRLSEQSLKAALGDPEAMQVDESFLLALENAMPPAGGLGIGLDRLVMLLTDTSIREILTFPFVRPPQAG